MVIEAGVVTGYVIAWAVRKARRIGGRLDVETDAAIDASLDRLHEVVEAKLRGYPVLAELVAETAADNGSGEVSDLTRQQIELAVQAAAQKDDAFGQLVTELATRLQAAEAAAGGQIYAAPGSTVFTGNAEANADNGGNAFGQVGTVNMNRQHPDPHQPGSAER